MLEPMRISIDVGPEGPDFQVGNFLNSLDHLINWYTEHLGLDSEQIGYAMACYLKCKYQAPQEL